MRRPRVGLSTSSDEKAITPFITSSSSRSGMRSLIITLLELLEAMEYLKGHFHT
uniref:Uncharacterized protein n=1 Tax=Lepeophtheirus salmonis TaxID=72036 RepID=A0A0K2ULR9_LEPSM